MENSPLSTNMTETLQDALSYMSRQVSLEDYLLVPAVILGTSFVLNRGHFWPQGKGPHYHKYFDKPALMLNGGAASGPPRTRNIAEKLEETKADVVVFWGSQSGTAEAFSHRLARDLHQQFKLGCVVADLSDYDPETVALLPASKLAVFVMSTFGEGDPSDNAQDFLSWISGAPAAALQHLRFAAFGCGNSNYRYYNQVIENVVGHLHSAGAKALLPTGRGNEATRTTDDDFADWKENLFHVLVSDLGLQRFDIEFEPTLNIVDDCTLSPGELAIGEPFHKTVAKDTAALRTPVFSSSVKMRQALAEYPGGDRTAIHLEVDLSAHSEVKYKTGDHLAVWPVNPEPEVQNLLRILGIEDKQDKPIRISCRDSDNDEPPVPGASTPKALFRYYLEIGAPVSRETVMTLKQFAPTEDARQKLQSIGQDRQTFTEFLKSDYLTLSRLLRFTAPSWSHLPLAVAVELLSPMQPRVYSIASSRITSPRSVGLTVAVKPSMVKPDLAIDGLCSTYLSQVQTTAQSRESGDAPTNDSAGVSAAVVPGAWAQVRPSTFKLPTTSTTPVIMVAAGTGIAPFRGFLQERARLAVVGREVGPMLLFFGCQAEHDYLYSEELAKLAAEPLKGKLEIITAFSRSTSKKQKKMYVQDRVQQRAADVGRLMLREDAAFYICGAATMAQLVGNVVQAAVKGIEGWNDEEVEAWRRNKKKTKRWFEDAWS